MSTSERIAQHRTEMPRRFRDNYDRAMSGKTRKAAMYLFCCERSGYEIREVHRCTRPECPLYPYRPRSRVSQGAPQSVPERPESTNAGKRNTR